MALIGKHNINNASKISCGLDVSKLKFHDIKDGMIVNVCEDNKDNDLYLVVCRENLKNDLIFNMEDVYKMYLITKDDENQYGFNYWVLDLFDRRFPNHNEWGNDVKITQVWDTKIDTSKMSISKLRKVFANIEDVINQ